MKREINHLIDTGILNPTTIVTIGNSQATTLPSACDRSQSHFDKIEYHDDIMLSPRKETSITNN